MIKKLQILDEIPFSELVQKLKRVTLKGFPQIKIYEDALISIKSFSPQQVQQELFTPQPTVYRKGFLDRVNQLADIFSHYGINIFKLTGAYNYVATDENNIETVWTLMPPVVELIPFCPLYNNGLDYSEMFDPELRKILQQNGHSLNPELLALNYPEYQKFSGLTQVPIICDGSHRVHAAFEKNITQHVIKIDAPKKGFPYYAAPKPYSKVHVEEERTDKLVSDKTHVVTEPGHKLLYRLFPTGGILTGDVRTK